MSSTEQEHLMHVGFTFNVAGKSVWLQVIPLHDMLPVDPVALHALNEDLRAYTAALVRYDERVGIFMGHGLVARVIVHVVDAETEPEASDPKDVALPMGDEAVQLERLRRMEPELTPDQKRAAYASLDALTFYVREATSTVHRAYLDRDRDNLAGPKDLIAQMAKEHIIGIIKST